MSKTTEAASPAAFLSHLDRNIRAAERDLDKQTRFVAGLQLARESVASAILTDAVRPTHHHKNKDGSVSRSSRTQMLKTILSSASEPVTVDEIVAELQRHGRLDEKRLVHSTLSYLKRIGVAKTPERGKWTIVTMETAAIRAAA